MTENFTHIFKSRLCSQTLNRPDAWEFLANLEEIRDQDGKKDFSPQEVAEAIKMLNAMRFCGYCSTSITQGITAKNLDQLAKDIRKKLGKSKIECNGTAVLMRDQEQRIFVPKVGHERHKGKILCEGNPIVGHCLSIGYAQGVRVTLEQSPNSGEVYIGVTGGYIVTEIAEESISR